MGKIFIPQFFLPRANDYIEPMATFIAWAKIYTSAIKRLGEIFVQWKVSAVQYQRESSGYKIIIIINMFLSLEWGRCEYRRRWEDQDWPGSFGFTEVLDLQPEPVCYDSITNVASNFTIPWSWTCLSMTRLQQGSGDGIGINNKITAALCSIMYKFVLFVHTVLPHIYIFPIKG